MRLVLDTSVMVAAIRSGAGASRRLLVAALQQQFALPVSVPLMIEYQAVMTRPVHLRSAHLTTDDVNVLLDAVAAVAEPTRLAFLWRPAARDPDDDMVLETAVNGRANIIVSFNVRDLREPALRFGVEVLWPGEALKRLEHTHEKK